MISVFCLLKNGGNFSSYEWFGKHFFIWAHLILEPGVLKS